MARFLADTARPERIVARHAQAAGDACSAFRDANSRSIDVFNAYIGASNADAPDTRTKSDTAMNA